MTLQQSNSDSYDIHMHYIESKLISVCNKLNIKFKELVFYNLILLNFVLGKLVQWTSPEGSDSYFSDKRNVLNQVFVKRGWGWTTFVVFAFYAILLYHGQHPLVQTAKQKRQMIKNGLLKYAAATTWWILYTQWCFGLPIMDKVFIWTGGKCTDIEHEHLSRKIPKFQNSGLFDMIEAELKYESQRISSYTCRSLRGTWNGGHDPSGHVFLLVHSSLYLFLETMPFLYSWSRLMSSWSAYRHSANTRDSRKNSLKILLNHPHILVFPLLALWWFMLFMTNIYFHSMAEKLVGLIFGYIGIFLMYNVPKYF